MQKREYHRFITTSGQICLTIALLFLGSIQVAKAQVLKISDALSWMGKTQSQVISKMTSVGFVYKGKELEFLKYSKRYDMGVCNVTIAFKNNQLNVISWNEFVGYAGELRGEVTTAGFQEVGGFDITKGFKNYDRGLILTLIDHSTTANEIVVTIGKMTASESNKKKITTSSEKINKQKNTPSQAKFTTSTQSDSINSRLFTGTKSFCDAEKIWKYVVTIKNDSLTLKLFPGSANDYHKNKSKPIEIIKGIVVNGKIVTKDAPEYLTNRFKYVNGILYEVNNEGGYNEYPECK